MPVQRCQSKGRRGWKWGGQGKCYVGKGAYARALRQGRAARASGYTGNARGRVRTQVVPSNPLKADPTRTATLRRVFQTEISKRFARLRRKIMQLVVEEDAFGLKRKQSIFNKEQSDDQAIGVSATIYEEQQTNSGAVGESGVEVTGTQQPSIFNKERGDVGNDRAEVGKNQREIVSHRKAASDTGGERNGNTPSRLSVTNQRWAFHSDPQKVAAFRQWLERQAQMDILEGAASELDQAYWQRYVQEGYRKGAGRAFDDTRKVALQDQGAVSDFYQGTKDEFLRSAFAQPVAIEKVQLLAGRVYTGLKGVTEEMSTKMTRILADGLTMGQNPTKIARTLIAEGMGFTKRRGVQSRALTIARTEIIRAHAEGQLDAFENLGVTKLGVMAEWSTAGDDRVCPLCSSLEGVVLSVKEARGILPRHPSCRCAYIPANVGEKTTGQKRSKTEVRKAMDDSIRAEMPKIKKRTLAQQKRRTSWAGADKTIAKKRPKSILGD